MYIVSTRAIYTLKVVSRVLLPDISSNSGEKAGCELWFKAASATSGLKHTVANGFAFGHSRNTQF